MFFRQVIKSNPLIAIFSVSGEDRPLEGANHTVADFIMSLARMLMLQNWKNPQHRDYFMVERCHTALETGEAQVILRVTADIFEKMHGSFMVYTLIVIIVVCFWKNRINVLRLNS